MNKRSVSKRLEKVPASPIRKLVPFAQQAKKDGVTVYHLNIGDPDIKTPDVMLKALTSWDRDPISYSQSQGEPSFLLALKTYYHRFGFPFIEEKHIQVTTGGSEAVSMAMFSICNPGDEVIVFEPFYANYNTYAAVNGITLVPIPTKLENGFHLPERKIIEEKITNKTKAILICSPNNPTGTVYTKEEMDMLISIAKKYTLFLLSDEVYREFCYDGKRQVSLFSYMEEIPNQAIVLDSLSKRYSLCGARLGCLVSLNKEIMDGVLRIAQGRLSSGLIDQVMASKLTEVPSSYMKNVQAEYQKRRDVLFEELGKIKGIDLPPKPEGAFYAIVGLPVKDAEDFCKFLLTTFRDNNETVMLAPAAGFYASTSLSTGATIGKNEVRIAYVLNTTAIKRSVEIITEALKQYISSY
ncbi:MAG: Aspartate transaminase [Candidatus Gottesmanbacteria bacterium GW2011_GWA2_44_17]|uniref:Aminotransferase n=2 Tax=Candidatus Gottesmaniibacteriota TaxID=1752720 RepID=A0A0G1IMQ5_9BACT|nr:MAG: Aspartate transaminase [Microgenomates group bacterium GW2011_GWC1_43_11]KKT46525.1 MAG: Aspartate transaminase [Candidatus Gottesmanbacteria bacterium GW2011_GWA2_44_17]KKT60681.1 MAG: Aspartate transaminase [Candidatus Gottesmanbacteria bacterium GW2011_GWA1_44_24b]HCM82661.1 pyridoxal phosphate-dependent aminotransferase [Patescibacteria group bacterium]